MESGRLFAFGGHVVLCGDARSPEDQALLMAGEEAKLAIHDPPYGFADKVWWGFGDGKRHGSAKWERGTFPPVVGNDRPFDPTHLLGSGQTVILWGANHYADKLPSSPAWIIWDKRRGMPPNDQSDCELAWVSRGGATRMFVHRWSGFLRDSERLEKRIHPTQKPVALYEWLLERYTLPGDIVTDWYGGSGPLLIAAWKTGRRARIMEISMAYCRAMMERLLHYQRGEIGERQPKRVEEPSVLGR